VTSFASAVYTAWTLREEWRGADGRPRALPKRGDGSFDVLVKGVTRDLRPSSVLAELTRLGYVEAGPDDTIQLAGDAFLSREFADRPARRREPAGPRGCGGRQRSAVPPFLERTLFADELSPESAKALRKKRAMEARARRIDRARRRTRSRGPGAGTPGFGIRVGVFDTPKRRRRAATRAKDTDDE
jgi:hypothetical protein